MNSLLSNLCKNTSTIVGIEMAIYSCDHELKNIESPGNKIRPIDQNNSNTIEVIILALPPVMSATEKFVLFQPNNLRYRYTNTYELRNRKCTSKRTSTLTYTGRRHAFQMCWPIQPNSRKPFASAYQSASHNAGSFYEFENHIFRTRIPKIQTASLHF